MMLAVIVMWSSVMKMNFSNFVGFSCETKANVFRCLTKDCQTVVPVESHRISLEELR